MKRVLFAIAIIAGFAYACSSSNESDTAQDSVTKCENKPLNPNGDSELALLMREMVNWTDSCKSAIESGRPMPPKPEKLGNLHTAKRTDETIDAALFNSLASLYQGAVLHFEQSTDADRKEMYNSMVSACAGCHQNFCQGPLVRIRKLMIE